MSHVCGYTHRHNIHTRATSSVVDGFVGCLHFLAVVSSVAMRIGVHVS